MTGIVNDLVVILGVLAVPLGLVVFAVSIDKKSGRGYGLGVLSAAAIFLNVGLTVLYFQAEEQSRATHLDSMGFFVVVILYLLATFCPALAIVIGGITEAIIARQWGWLALIVAVTLILTALTIGIGGALIPDFPAALGLSRDGELLAWLFPPMVVTLIYAVARIIRPVAPAVARQPLAAQ